MNTHFGPTIQDLLLNCCILFFHFHIVPYFLFLVSKSRENYSLLNLKFGRLWKNRRLNTANSPSNEYTILGNHGYFPTHRQHQVQLQTVGVADINTPDGNNNPGMGSVANVATFKKKKKVTSDKSFDFFWCYWGRTLPVAVRAGDDDSSTSRLQITHA